MQQRIFKAVLKAETKSARRAWCTGGIRCWNTWLEYIAGIHCFLNEDSSYYDQTMIKLPRLIARSSHSCTSLCLGAKTLGVKFMNADGIPSCQWWMVCGVQPANKSAVSTFLRRAPNTSEIHKGVFVKDENTKGRLPRRLVNRKLYSENCKFFKFNLLRQCTNEKKVSLPHKSAVHHKYSLLIKSSFEWAAWPRAVRGILRITKKRPK